MSMLAWIHAKRDGGRLADDEVAAVVEGVTRGTIPDYQVAAFLMAVFFRGLDEAETAALTDAMVRSGTRLDLTSVPGVKVDKHSTGGVGDKVSLVLAPAVAACGGRVPMISGRALGHTGGTLDKLESIPGFRTDLDLAELEDQVADLGVAFGAATQDLAPADRALYRLRDATATVESIPLITSSILAKKVAEGIDALVLDVKTGSGAFLPDAARARRLAETLVATGTRLGVKTVARLTDMSQPLGRAVGNALEVEEAIATLAGGGPADLREVTVALGAEMLVLAGIARDLADGSARLGAALADGSALARFRAVVERQGGDPRIVDGTVPLPAGARRTMIVAERAGFLQAVDTRAVGLASNALGAGRERMEEAVAPGAGLLVRARIGDRLAAGDPLVEAVLDDEARLPRARRLLADAFRIGAVPAEPPVLVGERITAPEQPARG